MRSCRADPQGREIAKYWFLRPFWPRTAPWHLNKFPVENRKTQFPGARGTFGNKIHSPQKFLPKIAQLFWILCFGRPQWRKIAKYWSFRPFWPRAALGTWRNSGPGSKTEKSDFPELGVPKRRGKKSYHPIWDSCPQLFLHLMFCPTRPPRAGNREKRGFQAILAFGN